MSAEPSLFFIRAPLSGLATPVTKEFGKAAQSFLAQFTRTAATPQTGIVSIITNFFTKIGQAGARGKRGSPTQKQPSTPFQQIPLTPAKTTVGISGKTTAAILGTSGAAIGTVGILSFTEQGQELTKSAEKIAEDASKAAQNISQFLTDNPIVLPLALGIGLIVVLKA